CARSDYGPNYGYFDSW
nr:immunoglobulin heavy chain junction region [Macaca mulatta]